MKREDYRRAFDQIPFSPDFEARTQALLHQRARELEKEPEIMKFTSLKKKFAVAAATVAALAVSVSAAVLLLSPAQVAERSGQPALAAAFGSADAVRVEETKTVGDYNVTLQGLVSGQGLTDYSAEVDGSRTYVVLSIDRRDGAPLTEVPYELAFTPLIRGYNAWSVNAWTLGGGWTAFAENGTGYYLFETESVEMFADQTVYFAVYEGMAPSTEQFEMHEDGSITMREGVVGAMFTLPLDASKADPAAAKALVDQLGIDTTIMTDEVCAAMDVGSLHVEQDQEGSFIITDQKPFAESDAYTAETFAPYAEAEKAKLARELKDGTLSQESYDACVRDLDEALAGLKDGTLSVYPLEDGFATAANAAEGYHVSYSATSDGIQMTIH